MEGGGEESLIYTGPEGKPGGESRFPLSFKTDGVLKYKVIHNNNNNNNKY